MNTLRDFLKEQAEARRGKAAEMEAIRRDWVEAVEELIDQMVSWLNEADPEHILELETPVIQKREEGLGSYQVKSLTIRLDSREVRVVPVARNVIWSESGNSDLDSRALGRVDLTDGLRKHLLYRTANTDRLPWIIVFDDNKYGLYGLDKEYFEKAVQDLLE